ncbi:MAG: hypothetical protein HYY30_14510 [Chloroflexi bacterium]|nr:hypothetical protein [Chloroflexota bacterium]
MESQEIGRFISPELYNRFKQQVFELSLAIQEYSGTTQSRETRCLSDAEIGERLGLTKEQVSEIRSIAEIDLLAADEWWKADRFKARRARRLLRDSEE